MKDFTVLKGTKKSPTLVCLDVQVLGATAPEFWEFYDTLAGFVWEPIPYFLILGEEKIDPHHAFQDARGILRILDEHESDSLSINEFLSRMTDSLCLMGADTIYTDLKGKDDRTDLFYQYIDKHRLSHLRLWPAPFAESFRLGMSVTQDWIREGLLRIPKESLVWNQLEGFSPKEFGEDPEKRFYRLRALTFAVCAFQKFGRKVVLKDTYRAKEGDWAL